MSTLGKASGYTHRTLVAVAKGEHRSRYSWRVPVDDVEKEAREYCQTNEATVYVLDHIGRRKFVCATQQAAR